MFRISLEIMSEMAKELHKDAGQLRSCADELQQAISALSEFSYMDSSRQRLMYEKDCIETEAEKAILLGRSLLSIQERYWQADRRASDYCEDVSRVLPRETVSYQDVSWLAGFAEMFL